MVCSARSPATKSEGTTNLLLRAARIILTPGLECFREIVEIIRADHVKAGRHTIVNFGVQADYIESVNQECSGLIKVLESAQLMKAVTDQTRDMIISVGERLSSLYMTAVLRDHGINAVFIDLGGVVRLPPGAQLSEDCYKNVSIGASALLQSFNDDIVPVFTGYFGPIPGGIMAGIGRGYTDLCAALVAIGLSADELQIWKEVDGIFTADPGKVPNARLLNAISPEEAAGLTFYGSEVIHPLTMGHLIRADIPIHIRNVTKPNSSGTKVLPKQITHSLRTRRGSCYDRPLSKIERSRNLSILPAAITTKRGVTVLNLFSRDRKHTPRSLMSVFSILDRHGFSVDVISSSKVHCSMALHSRVPLLSAEGEHELQTEHHSLESVIENLTIWSRVTLTHNMAIVALIGSDLRGMVVLPEKVLSTLNALGIDSETISQGANEPNISCVVKESDADRALIVVHEALFTSEDPDSTISTT